jgi:hypothetical protein
LEEGQLNGNIKNYALKSLPLAYNPPVKERMVRIGAAKARPTA